MGSGTSITSLTTLGTSGLTHRMFKILMQESDRIKTDPSDFNTQVGGYDSLIKTKELSIKPIYWNWLRVLLNPNS